MALPESQGAIAVASGTLEARDEMQRRGAKPIESDAVSLCSTNLDVGMVLESALL